MKPQAGDPYSSNTLKFNAYVSRPLLDPRVDAEFRKAFTEEGYTTKPDNVSGTGLDI